MSPVNEYRIQVLQQDAITALAKIVTNEDVLPIVSKGLKKELLEKLAIITIRTKIPETLRSEMLYVQSIFTEIKKIQEGKLDQ